METVHWTVWLVIALGVVATCFLYWTASIAQRLLNVTVLIGEVECEIRDHLQELRHKEFAEVRKSIDRVASTTSEIHNRVALVARYREEIEQDEEDLRHGYQRPGR